MAQKEIVQPWLLTLIDRLAPQEKDVSEWVKQVKKVNPELTSSQLADFIGDKIVWIYTSQGALLALPGAVPGLGTLAQISIEGGAVSADFVLLVRNQTYLVFALGHAYGIRGRKTLIQDTLICMGLWTGALVLTKAGILRLGKKVANANIKKRLSAKILQAINRKVGTTILTKYGTKRGGVAVGKLIPFGVGMLVGGGFNYITMKAFKKFTCRHFEFKKVKTTKSKHR